MDAARGTPEFHVCSQGAGIQRIAEGCRVSRLSALPSGQVPAHPAPMPSSYVTADQLFLETARALGKSKQQTGFGFVAKLSDVRRGFTWNKYRGMDPVRAFGDLLFLLSFSYDGSQVYAYNKDAAIDEETGLIPNAYGPDLRDQLHGAIASLNKSLHTTTAILCPWRGVEDQHNAYFSPNDKLIEPNKMLSCQFFWDGKKLHAIVNFRTLDAWEMPYEVFTWSRMLSIVAGYVSVPPGEVQIQAGEIHMRGREIDEEMYSEGWYDRVPPLKIDDSPMAATMADPVGQFSDAACVEELIRKDFKFLEHKNDLERFFPYTTITTCLAISYLRGVRETIKEIPAGKHLRLSKARKVFSRILGEYCDENLSEAAITSLWTNEQNNHKQNHPPRSR